MRRSNFALRVQPSLLEEARRAAATEGVALNQLINVALAEKVSILRTEEYFRERASRADVAEALRILESAGKGSPPLEGDELPPDWQGWPDDKPNRKSAVGRSAATKRPRAKQRTS